MPLISEFHAEYAGRKVLIDIAEAAVFQGFFPARQLKFVIAWAELHREELIENWRLAQAKEQILKIEPLR